MSKLRILYVASEINPFLQITDVAEYVRKLPQAMQERGMEIRILVPRFGLINERKNRLHEVVRLSGINISVGDDEKPLVIKVASVPSAKLQVYFIDNEDYFHRKSVFFDKDEKFYDDNDERAIFFCKGVIETVRKLGWSPDIVHCNDWMTALIPLYLKTTYRNDPMFKDTKSVFSVYNNPFSYKFTEELLDKVKAMDIEDDMLSSLSSLDYDGFIKIGAQYADVVVKAEEDYSESVNQILNDIPDKKVELPEEQEEMSDKFYSLYTELMS
ncbi:glycogen synthase [Siphonobacter sp. BAB-5385]|uniref:starch synthase n=1 Tax=Siphonobacter curvatus TaxID=2094562 RepID=A0A2S7IM27_9BACT|nr:MULTISPECIES: glycogen/starch synthase [Siphonobacter]OZI09092.1 glycogen synthase [Siphonobacter sp. BAB-5385]PMD98108.1 glycogen synthase [Siphonobacter sp. BAB-5405]PQA58777.1 glycogen synthase [Siphonobacter curvatus]